MRYEVTRSCGHTERVQLYGNAEWRLANVEPNKLCYDCWQEELARKRREAVKKAGEDAEAEGWPSLGGSAKQVEWAAPLRSALVAKAQGYMYDSHGNFAVKAARILNVPLGAPSDLHIKIGLAPIPDEILLAREEVMDRLIRHDRAHWWIEHRDAAESNASFGALVDGILRELASASEIDVPLVAEDALTEATVAPANPITKVVAEVRLKENDLEVDYPEFRDEFRTVVKSLKMRWSKADGVWRRRLLPRNGSSVDRAAEACHRLLTAGFPIRVYDPEIRDKAVSGDFAPEAVRWVLARTNGQRAGWFVLEWPYGEGRGLFDAAKRLPGAKYSKPHVLVPPESFEEVMDFARMYDFEISDGARRLAEAALERRNAALKVNVISMEDRRRPAPTGKPPTLEVPAEVVVDDSLAD